MSGVLASPRRASVLLHHVVKDVCVHCQLLKSSYRNAIQMEPNSILNGESLAVPLIELGVGVRLKM